MDLEVPLSPVAPAAVASLASDPATLHAVKMYLSVARLQAVDIPADVATLLEGEFVRIRQENTNFQPQDFHRDLEIARYRRLFAYMLSSVDSHAVSAFPFS